MDTGERIREATEGAMEAFWAVIARKFPEASTGDLDPAASTAFDDAVDNVVWAWVEANVPDTRVYYELRASDVGRTTIRAFGRIWPVLDFMGRIMRQDVGKRVYLHTSGEFLQVENDDQMRARVKS